VDVATMTVGGLVRDWDFVSSPVRPPRVRQTVVRFLRRLRLAPRFAAIKPLVRHPRWTLYFVFSPDGALRPGHLFTIERLRALDRKLMVICAAPSPDSIPEALARHADALYWKGLSGFDFSAYTIGLRAIAKASEHADVLVLNDSVYGPFHDLKLLIARARWDLTGFTASAEIENHIQSYAFHLRDVDRRRLGSMCSVFVPRLAFNKRADVIFGQETRMARVAAKTMSVGALWFAQGVGLLNPTMVAPFELLSDGFPFVKRTLLGPDAGPELRVRVRSWLAERGHPPVP
jgi:lipopolysaccharide biosynthesis protein